MHGCVVNFVMHYYYNCLDSDINVCDALLLAPETVSFLIFLKNKNASLSLAMTSRRKLLHCNFRRSGGGPMKVKAFRGFFVG
jgi:hypothetical protein